MRVACTGLLSWFERKANIVTPSRLLAAVADEQFGKHQLDRGRESWERPGMYTMETWLASQWQKVRYCAANVPTLLSPTQEHVLWQSIIEREHPNLFDPYATASLARSAARLIAEWHIPLDSDMWSDTQDAQEFRRWFQLFRQKCKQEGWIARFDLWRLAPTWLDNGQASCELTCFVVSEKVSPAFERVKQALGSSAAIETMDAPRSQRRVPAASFADFHQEIEHAARWARSIHEQDSSKSIGIFVPELARHRGLVERTFRNVFYPSTALDVNRKPPSVFRIDAPAPLQNHPLVAGALLLLELARPRIHYADACAILRSPFLQGAIAERSARALADVELRKRRELDVSLRDMEFATERCPLLATVWPRVRRVLCDKPQRRELPAWSELFGDLLAAVGWPGDPELAVEEQEIVQAWQDALSGLAALGLVSSPVTYEEAIAHLRRLLASRPVNAGHWSSPIQILDASDAAGLRFDSAVATGLSEETWPVAVNVSALVPVRLQRAHHVPGSSPVSVQEERQRATEDLFGVAPALLVTYSGRLSPAVERFVQSGRPALPEWPGKLPRESYVPVALEEFEDSHAPPYQPTETTRGGASLIKAQSLCPFRGFAEFRLAARLPEDACFGYDARDRGGFLHAALKVVWERLQTQGQLRGTTPEELRAIVRDAVTQAVADSQSSPLYQLATRAERERLEELILGWLEIERNRKRPFTVQMVEEDLHYDLAGLRLRLRLDRIDRLDNGHLVLIDYKSGEQTKTKLEGERPFEPQLLVYAAAVAEEVDGIFFAQLKPRELKAVGFSRDKHFSHQTAAVRKDWDSYLARSRSNVEQIATGFLEGSAAVDPIKGACQYCNLQPLCRVHERNASDGEEDFD
jgi:probable DNA repair protein